MFPFSGLFIFTVVTVGEQPIASLHEVGRPQVSSLTAWLCGQSFAKQSIDNFARLFQVSSFTQSNEAMDDLGRVVEKIKFCLQKVCANSCTVKERDQH